MGDHGKLYVPEDLVAVYRDEMTRVATTMTPNQFEVQPRDPPEPNPQQCDPDLAHNMRGRATHRDKNPRRSMGAQPPILSPES